MIKKCVLLFLCSLLFVMTGCSWNHNSNNNNNAANQEMYANVEVNIPLPNVAPNMRGSLKANINAEDFNVWYYLNGDGAPIPATSIEGLDSSNAKCTFEGVSNKSDIIFKSQIREGGVFKDYYQGLVSKNEINGNPLTKNLDSESTAKAMLFEKKLEEQSDFSVSQLESSLGEQNVWYYLGVGQDTFQNALDNLALDGTEIKEAVEQGAKKIEDNPTPTPEPTPTPTPTPEPTPTITEQGLTEEFTSLNFTPLASLAAINNLGAGPLADVSEGGEFIGSYVGLRLAAEGSLDGNVREWHVYEGDSRLMLINGIATTRDQVLEQQKFHEMFYNSYNVGRSVYFNQQTTPGFHCVNVKVTNGVADVAISYGDGLNWEETNYENWEREHHEWSVSAASHEGSVYVRVEDPTTGMARIFDCSTADLE